MVAHLEIRNHLKLNFQPHPLARNVHFQTIVSTLRRNEGLTLRRTAEEIILEAGHGVRLQGYYSAQPTGQTRGLVMLLHGWLGCAGSNYVLTIGEHLYRRGYSIFRLNLRDHGDTHHLNPGLFRSDLLDEVFAATRRIAHLESDHPFHLIGASLGGNFVVRLAWRHAQTPIPNLNQTIAINPVINPAATTARLDTGFPIYLAYFRHKWRKSLQKKEAAYPNRYDFSEMLAASTCLAMTEALVRHHTPYPDAQSYFARYTITPEIVAALQSPVAMITAADDPIVPVIDFYPLSDLTDHLWVCIQPYGGHVGFIDIFPFRHWLNEAIPAILENS